MEGNKKRVPVKEREIREKDLIHFRVQSRTLDSKKMSPGRDMYALMDRTAGSEILGLVEELLGKHPGEHLTLKRTYPSEHPKKAWAGREVEHRIEIKAVFEFVKPALDGEFLQSLGIQNEEEFRRKLKDDYEHQQEHRREDLILEHIFKTFQQLAQFPLPQTLIRQGAEPPSRPEPHAPPFPG